MTPQPSIALHPAARARNMITIASGKGGVGKTLLAICIAQAFSKASQTTLLFDGDFGLANVDIQLGLMPEHDLGSVITGRIAIDEAVTRFEDGGFDILAGKSGSGALAQLSKERLEMVRKALMGIAASYDRVVVDLGAGIHNDARMLAASSGTVVVIATDEPTSLTDAYAFIKVTNAQYPGTDIRILVNMAQSAREGKRTYETLRKACESPGGRGGRHRPSHDHDDWRQAASAAGCRRACPRQPRRRNQDVPWSGPGRRCPSRRRHHRRAAPNRCDNCGATHTSSRPRRYLFDAHRHGDTAADRGHRIGNSNHRDCRIRRAIGTDGDPDLGGSRGGGNARPPATGNGGSHGGGSRAGKPNRQRHGGIFSAPRR